MKPVTNAASQEHSVPAEQMGYLYAFEGRWRVEGKNFPVGPDRLLADVRGEESYEWLPGKFFMKGAWSHRFDGGCHEGMSIIQFLENRQRLASRNFDNLGFEKTYLLERYDTIWKFLGDAQRAVRIFGADGDSFEEIWEVRGENGEWQRLCQRYGKRIT